MRKQHDNCITSTVTVNTAATSPLSRVWQSPRKMAPCCDVTVSEPMVQEW